MPFSFDYKNYFHRFTTRISLSYSSYSYIDQIFAARDVFE